MAGHKHADLMAQYAEDAKATEKPWLLWEALYTDGKTRDLDTHPCWSVHVDYAKKVKSKLIHGVEVPDITIIPGTDQLYYCPCVKKHQMFDIFRWINCPQDFHRLDHNLCYPYNEKGKQATIKHTKALLGVIQ